MISFLVAMDEHRVIGSNNQIPWHIPEDLKYFKRVTMGHPVVMGRKTHESIGKALPGRQNIVITRQQNYQSDGCLVFHSVQEFLEFCRGRNDEIFVIGGEEIFKEMFAYADRLYITQILALFSGDRFFPKFDESGWMLVSSVKGNPDGKNAYDYDFKIYERISS